MYIHGHGIVATLHLSHPFLSDERFQIVLRGFLGDQSTDVEREATPITHRKQ